MSWARRKTASYSVLRPHYLNKTVQNSCAILYCLHIHALTTLTKPFWVALFCTACTFTRQEILFVWYHKHIFKPRIELGTSGVLDWRDNQLFGWYHKHIFKPRIELGTSSVLDWRDNQLHYLNTESESPIFAYIFQLRATGDHVQEPLGNLPKPGAQECHNQQHSAKVETSMQTKQSHFCVWSTWTLPGGLPAISQSRSWLNMCSTKIRSSSPKKTIQQHFLFFGWLVGFYESQNPEMLWESKITILIFRDLHIWHPWSHSLTLTSFQNQKNKQNKQNKSHMSQLNQRPFAY